MQRPAHTGVRRPGMSSPTMKPVRTALPSAQREAAERKRDGKLGQDRRADGDGQHG